MWNILRISLLNIFKILLWDTFKIFSWNILGTTLYTYYFRFILVEYFRNIVEYFKNILAKYFNNIFVENFRNIVLEYYIYLFHLNDRTSFQGLDSVFLLYWFHYNLRYWFFKNLFHVNPSETTLTRQNLKNLWKINNILFELTSFLNCQFIQGSFIIETDKNLFLLQNWVFVL